MRECLDAVYAMNDGRKRCVLCETVEKGAREAESGCESKKEEASVWGWQVHGQGQGGSDVLKAGLSKGGFELRVHAHTHLRLDASDTKTQTEAQIRGIMCSTLCRRFVRRIENRSAA